jgi:hypothetical protein
MYSLSKKVGAVLVVVTFKMLEALELDRNMQQRERTEEHLMQALAVDRMCTPVLIWNVVQRTSYKTIMLRVLLGVI